MDSIWGDLEIDVHGRIDGGDRTEAASRIARFWRPRALPRRQAGPRWTDARPRLLARAAADGSRGHQRTPGLTPTPPGANRYIRRASFSAARRLHSSVRCARIPGPLTHLRPQPSGSFSPSCCATCHLFADLRRRQRGLVKPCLRSCLALSHRPVRRLRLQPWLVGSSAPPHTIRKAGGEAYVCQAVHANEPPV